MNTQMRIWALILILAALVNSFGEVEGVNMEEVLPIDSTERDVGFHKLISFQIENTPFHEVVRLIADQVGIEIFFPENLREPGRTQSVSLTDVYWEEAVEVLLEPEFELQKLREDLYLVVEVKEGSPPGRIDEDLDLMEMISGGFLKNLLNVYKEILNDPEWANALATFDRNYYLALIDKGFTEDQAFRLVMKQDAPVLDSFLQE